MWESVFSTYYGFWWSNWSCQACVILSAISLTLLWFLTGKKASFVACYVLRGRRWGGVSLSLLFSLSGLWRFCHTCFCNLYDNGKGALTLELSLLGQIHWLSEVWLKRDFIDRRYSSSICFEKRELNYFSHGRYLFCVEL